MALPYIDTVVSTVLDSVRKSGLLESFLVSGQVSSIGTDGTVTVTRGSDTYPKVRVLSGYLSPTVGDTVSILRGVSGWICPGRWRTTSAPRIQSAKVAGNSGTADTWLDTAVTFPVPFANVPRVTATPSSGIGGSTDLQVTVDSETATGFTLRIKRGNTATPTYVNYIATDF